MKTIELLLITMRPHRWSRSSVIFLPLIFSGNPLNWVYLLKIFVGFVIFSLLTGAINIIEDITSAKSDGSDSAKRVSPVLSGELSINKAEFALGAVLVGSFVASFFLGPSFGIVAVIYFFVSLAYFLYLKKIIFLDIITVATAAGAVIIIMLEGILTVIKIPEAGRKMASGLILLIMILLYYRKKRNGK